MSEEPSATVRPAAASAISGHLDTRTAATEVANELHDGLDEPCDLAIIFASYHHCAALPEAVDTIRKTIDPATTLAVTTEAVLGGDQEFERVAGLSGIAMQLPDVTLTPWMSTPDDPIRIADPQSVAQRINVTDDFRAAIVLAEPFTTPITKLLPALTGCGGDQPVPLIGGMASGASQPGHNVMVLDDRVFKAGAIGVSIAGRVVIDSVVSQGCRPIGDPLVITGAEGNAILELGGRKSLEVLQDLTNELGEHERELITKGLLIGNVIDEQRRPFGRGDFLVRSLLGVDTKRGGIVVGDLPRLGQTVQFHVRDAVTAEEDLQLLLDAHVLEQHPFAALLFTCNGRGEHLFGRPNHDTDIINERIGPIPIAGFFAAGEIGPVGNQSFVHGHTASLALFREPGDGTDAAGAEPTESS